MEKTKLAEKSDYEDCEVRRGTTRWVLIISSLVLLAFLVVTVIYGYHNFGLPGRKNLFSIFRYCIFNWVPTFDFIYVSHFEFFSVKGAKRTQSQS